MKKLRLLLFLMAILSITSCKKSTENSEDFEEISTTTDEDGNEAYPDGTYCADIDYYNPDSGTRSTYTLNVEVENNEVTVIHWPNGGWLDDSHFSPEELDSSGSCSFTSDKGYEYTIQITGPECSYTDETKVQNDSEDDQAALTCPMCGGAKESYDEMCYFCKSRQEDEQNNQIEE